MAEPRILLFHKPKGVVVTASDELGRRTVYDVLPAWVCRERWVPVGRLDRDTRGLLLFVREGSLVEALARPGVLPRTYEAEVRGHLQQGHLADLAAGVRTPVGTLSCVRADVMGYAGPKTRVRIVLDEGKNRHVRRMLGALRDERFGTSLKVLDLKRVAYGPIGLDVASGQWRFLTPDEERLLLSAAGA